MHIHEHARILTSMQIFKAIFGLIFLVPLGLFLCQFVFGAWWVFPVGVLLLVALSLIQASRKQATRHRAVKTDIARRVTELQHETPDDYEPSEGVVDLYPWDDPTWPTHPVDLDKPDDHPTC